MATGRQVFANTGSSLTSAQHWRDAGKRQQYQGKRDLFSHTAESFEPDRAAGAIKENPCIPR